MSVCGVAAWRGVAVRQNSYSEHRPPVVLSLATKTLSARLYRLDPKSPEREVPKPLYIKKTSERYSTCTWKRLISDLAQKYRKNVIDTNGRGDIDMTMIRAE